MEQRIFDQLDMLERGARNISRPRRDELVDHDARHFTHDDYGPPAAYRSGHCRYGEEPLDVPIALDSLDEQLLCEPDYPSRQAQASHRQTRLPMTYNTGQAWCDLSRDIPPNTYNVPSTSQRLDLSAFACNSGQTAQSSDPRLDDQLPSSPAFNASQRRHPGFDHVRECDRPKLNHQRTDMNSQAEPQQPVSTRHLDVEPYQNQSQHHQQQALEDHRVVQTMPSSSRPSIAAPIVQGISLVSTHELPNRFRSMFPFPFFNAVQSKSFKVIWETKYNFVLSAPTGSGKTAVLELAICRLMNGFANDDYKIVYQAPTKSLCSERQRDWQAKFGPLGLQCAELTGDTDGAQLRNVQHASIIITTPEKWDSMTRKWKDHQRLMEMVKLFLIDEVHILKEGRGATLEAVVSRMKSVGSNVRFVALSATVPNSHDIATWLGKDPITPHIPASREKFGEEFRPVRLQKHVCGYQGTGNDFAFDKLLNGKLIYAITKWSQHKPLMVFCFTRKSCVETAKLLATWWASEGPRDRYWSPPRNHINVVDKDLRDTVTSGVAFHHAGLDSQDRGNVEKGYLQGDINVICCTSTLAVGVNLPCHMVIIKNTVTYQSPALGGCKEYSDLEIMQMLGRAGRPQFDDSAVAVVMTRLGRVPHYEKMVTGQEVLESTLHLNLIDHLNAEIGLGTISNVASAKSWLTGTFLYVRLKENPEYYKIEGDAPGRSLDERLEQICSKGITLLNQHDLVQLTPKLQCTEFGDAMTRYYLQFQTMKTFLALPPKSKISEILSAISQAAEFHAVRFRANEKGVYKDLNRNVSIKFPIPVNLDAPAHKVSLVIQAVLGAIELPTEDHNVSNDFTSAKAVIFSNVHRLVRCIIDCQLHMKDSITTRNALMLSRSLGAQVWDDSPLHMKQLEGVGIVSVRRLTSAGIKSIEDVEATEAQRLETLMSRNPPYGSQLQERARLFPKLRVTLKMIGAPMIKQGEYVFIKVKAEIGFLNDQTPEVFGGKPVYVCLLVDTSDGIMLHFARISAKKLNKGQDVHFEARLSSCLQAIRGHVMCDDIAATSRQAILTPDIPVAAFTPPKASNAPIARRGSEVRSPDLSKRCASAVSGRAKTQDEDDEFGDADIDDAALEMAERDGFVDIDDVDLTGDAAIEPEAKKRKIGDSRAASSLDRAPRQLSSGKWACNHRCTDKTTCKHACCRDGMDKKPKPPKPPKPKDASVNRQQTALDSEQSQINISVSKKVASSTRPSNSKQQTNASDTSREAQNLNCLHSSVKMLTPSVPVLWKTDATKPKSKQSTPSFLQPTAQVEQDKVDAFDSFDTWSDGNELPSVSEFVNPHPKNQVYPSQEPEAADDEILDFDFGDHNYDHIAESFGEGHADTSAYTSGLRADGERPRQQEVDMESPGTTIPRPCQSPAKSTLFVSSSTAMGGGDNPGVAPRTKGYTAELATDYDQTDSILSPQTHYAARTQTPSEQFTQLEQATGQPISDNSLLADVSEKGSLAEQKRPESPDDLEKWFNAEFGTEHFNLCL